MNLAQRTAITEMYEDFQNNLNIDIEFLGPLIQRAVLKNSMVEKIQVRLYSLLIL